MGTDLIDELLAEHAALRSLATDLMELIDHSAPRPRAVLSPARRRFLSLVTNHVVYEAEVVAELRRERTDPEF